MPNHALFVCQSCKFSREQKHYEGQSGGTHLLNQLMALYQAWSRRSELAIETSGCLWTCSYPCAVALSGTNKTTYLFTELPPLESATVLLQFGELYLDSDDGNVPWDQFPEALKCVTVAKIPPIPQCV
jgi:predicted metal-binding protein